MKRNTRNANVLVLDDEAALAGLLGEALDAIGLVPTLCNDAIEAFQWLEQREFDLIVCDVCMPGIDGRQFYQLAVQKMPLLANRFIFVTGYVVDSETKAFLQSNGLDLISKPFPLTQVERAVAKVLKVHTPASENHRRLFQSELWN
ncbi:MAG: response regulator [Candidatus Omnitrophica bacterium]|nr:response regulator [Candidatus Omnitrophota bacterium]